MAYAWRPLFRSPPAANFRNELDRLFGDFVGHLAAVDRRLSSARTFPSLNVWEDGDALVVEAEVPGLKSDDLEIAVVGTQLTIKGRRAAEPAPPSGTYHRRERGTGKFVRELTLPVEIDADHVRASLVDGVLQITLPKSAAAKPRRIPVGRS